jgi:lysophospholipase L1-like esterase
MKYLVLLLALLFPSFTKPKRILFVGDSLTCYSGGWQHQFAKGLGQDYVNLSSVGKRTDWMYKRLHDQLLTYSDYDMVVIYGGVNDAFSSVPLSKVTNNIQNMIDECIYYDIPVVVISGYSSNKILKRGPYSETIMSRARNRYDAIQKNINNKLMRCDVIPVDTTIDRSDSGDGIHLKASGHRKFAKFVLANIHYSK